MKTEYVIKIGTPFRGIPHSVLNNGCEIFIGGKIRADYETAEYEILSETEYQKLVDAFVSDFTGKWQEITKERYHDQLNILPPVKWFNGGFFISEAYTLNIHPFYQDYMGKYYEAYFSITTPRAEIIKTLTEFCQKKEKVTLIFRFEDDWGRAVFDGSNNRAYVTTDLIPRKGWAALNLEEKNMLIRSIHTRTPYGEPDTPCYREEKFFLGETV